MVIQDEDLRKKLAVCLGVNFNHAFGEMLKGYIKEKKLPLEVCGNGLSISDMVADADFRIKGEGPYDFSGCGFKITYSKSDFEDSFVEDDDVELPEFVKFEIGPILFDDRKNVRSSIEGKLWVKCQVKMFLFY